MPILTLREFQDLFKRLAQIAQEGAEAGVHTIVTAKGPVEVLVRKIPDKRPDLPDSNAMPIEEVVHRIVTLNDGLREFWANAEGWAPMEAAQLLSKSRLDWQVSLSACLNLWIAEPDEEDKSGRLILAWANLGSLVEGTMKLFLSVWYKNYIDDIEAIRRDGTLQDPDTLTLEPMRQFFRKRIWGDSCWNGWTQHIQQRRNAIHAYKDRDIGTHEELIADIRTYLEFLRYINGRLSYPDGIYEPREA